MVEFAGRNLRFLGGSAMAVLAALLACAVVGRGAAAADATPWKAPVSAKMLKNPVPGTPKNLAAGKDSYKLNCAPCHGDNGDGEGLMGSSLDPRATNFTDAKLMRVQTDGQLFWKLNEGRMPMPAFKDQLNETERWQLVDYVRTFAKAAPAGKTSSSPGK